MAEEALQVTERSSVPYVPSALRRIQSHKYIPRNPNDPNEHSDFQDCISKNATCHGIAGIELIQGV
jgi:hypothetical protein